MIEFLVGVGVGAALVKFWPQLTAFVLRKYNEWSE